MNDDLESRLQSLRYHTLPADWKAALLAASHQPPAKPLPSLAPPKGLAWGLAATWLVTLILHWLTPVPHRESPPFANAPSPVRAVQQRQELLALLTSNTASTP